MADVIGIRLLVHNFIDDGDDDDDHDAHNLKLVSWAHIRTSKCCRDDNQ